MSFECPKCGYEEPEDSEEEDELDVKPWPAFGLVVLFGLLGVPFGSDISGAAGLIGGLIGFWIEYRRVKRVIRESKPTSRS